MEYFKKESIVNDDNIKGNSKEKKNVMFFFFCIEHTNLYNNLTKIFRKSFIFIFENGMKVSRCVWHTHPITIIYLKNMYKSVKVHLKLEEEDNYVNKATQFK